MDEMEEYEKIGEEPKSDKKFLKGVLTGVIGTVLVGVLGLFIATNVMGGRMVIGESESKDAEQNTILGEKVQKKIAELLG